MAAIKRWNGSAWEETYPKTTVGNIVTTGSPSSTTFLSGTGVWATPAGTSNHSHGNINSSGQITSATQTVATGDHLIIRDVSNSSLISVGPVFGTSTSQFLRNDGFFAVPNPLRSITNFTAPISSNGTTAVALNVTETIVSGGKYAIEVSDSTSTTSNNQLLFWEQKTASSTGAAAGQMFTFTARTVSTTNTITYKFVIHRGNNTGFRIVNAYTHTLGTGSSHPIATTTAVRVWNIYRVGG